MRARVSATGFTLLLVLAGCGGESASRPGAVTPSGEAPPVPSAPGSDGVDESQYGISDDPAAEGGAERPRMNGGAATAYAAGMKAFRAQELRGALSQFSKATEADSRAFQAYYSLAVVKERLGDVGGALAAYRQATTIVPDYEPAIAGLSVLLARSGRPDEAVEYLNQRMAAMPKSAAVSAALAEVRSIQGDSGAAQRLAQEALKKRPDYRPAMVTIARDHYRARRLELALYALRGILDGYGAENPARDKDNAEARMMRGMIYKEQGLRGPSLTELKRAVERDPTWSRRGCSSRPTFSKPATRPRRRPCSRVRSATAPTTSSPTSTWVTPIACWENPQKPDVSWSGCCGKIRRFTRFTITLVSCTCSPTTSRA